MSIRRLSQGPVHPIVLVSCGWNKPGGRLLEKYRNELWHRVDQVFDSWEHLHWYGIYSQAQEQFLAVYGDRAKVCLRIVAEDIACQARVNEVAHVFVCKSGHHRSVAFIELLLEALRDRTHSLIRMWHLDNRRAEYNYIFSINE